MLTAFGPLGGVGIVDTAYAAQVAAVAPANLIAMWNMDEVTGTTALDYSGNARTGVYSGVTLDSYIGADGISPAPEFAGVSTGYLNVFSSSFNSAWDKKEFTISLWLKPANASVWSDAVNKVLFIFQASGSNYIYLNAGSSNTVTIEYRAGGTSKVISRTLTYALPLQHIIITVSKAADQFAMYWNYLQVGATLTGLGTWTGSLGATSTCIGAFNTTPSGTWKGSICSFAVWDRAFNATERAALRPTRRGAKQIIFDGDSITLGSNVAANLTYPAQTMALVGSGWVTQNLGVSGQTAAQVLTDVLTQVDSQYCPIYPKFVYVIMAGTNDLNAGNPVATVISRIVQICSERRANGLQVLVATMLPRSGGTPGSFNADRATFNASLRANWSTYADGLVDFAADSRIGDDGDETNTTYYAGDNIHPNATGYGVMAAICAAQVVLLP